MAQDFTSVKQISSSYVVETIFEEIQSNYARLHFDYTPTYVDLNFNNNVIVEVKPISRCRPCIALTVLQCGINLLAFFTIHCVYFVFNK
jgi:hypothetical protein